MQQVQTVTTEKITYICDRCGDKRDKEYNVCQGCLQDVCAACSDWVIDPFLFEPEDSLLCQACQKIQAKYYAAASALRNEAWAKLTAMEKQWQAECRSGKGAE